MDGSVLISVTCAFVFLPLIFMSLSNIFMAKRRYVFPSFVRWREIAETELRFHRAPSAPKNLDILFPTFEPIIVTQPKTQPQHLFPRTDKVGVFLGKVLQRDVYDSLKSTRWDLREVTKTMTIPLKRKGFWRMPFCVPLNIYSNDNVPCGHMPYVFKQNANLSDLKVGLNVTNYNLGPLGNLQRLFHSLPLLAHGLPLLVGEEGIDRSNKENEGTKNYRRPYLQSLLSPSSSPLVAHTLCGGFLLLLAFGFDLLGFGLVRVTMVWYEVGCWPRIGLAVCGLALLGGYQLLVWHGLAQWTRLPRGMTTSTA